MRTAIIALLCLLVTGGAAQAAGSAGPGVTPPALVPLHVKDVILVNDTPAVLLLDASQQRYLLMTVDFYMANAIRAGLNGPTPERPGTHDLIGTLVRALGGAFTRVTITGLRDRTYYALLSVQVKATGAVETFDARPSDAIAIAVRNDTPIFAPRALLRPIEGGEPEPAEPPPGEAPAPHGEA